MKLASVPLGRNFWGYLVFMLMASIIFCFTVASEMAKTARAIDTDFYMAMAAMLPVLLLALLVRIGRISQGLLRMKRKLRRNGKVEDQLADLKTSIEAILAKSELDEALIRTGEDQLRRVNEMIEDPQFNNESLNTASTRTIEVTFASLLLSLAVSAVGMCAALVPLATGNSTWATLALTGLGLVWLLYSLVALEIVSFQNALVADFLGLD